MFYLVGFVSVSYELVIAVQVKECITDYLDLIVFIYVGACRVECLAGLDGFGDACFNILEGFVKCILLKDLTEIIQGFDVAASGGLLVGSRGLD